MAGSSMQKCAFFKIVYRLNAPTSTIGEIENAKIAIFLNMQIKKMHYLWMSKCTKEWKIQPMNQYLIWFITIVISLNRQREHTKCWNYFSTNVRGRKGLKSRHKSFSNTNFCQKIISTFCMLLLTAKTDTLLFDVNFKFTLYFICMVHRVWG